MKYFYDTEFIEDGKTINLISIGIIAEDGREYYAVNSDMPLERIKGHKWLMDNVWPQLPLRHGYPTRPGTGVLDTTSTLVKPAWVIRNEVRNFLLLGYAANVPQLWAYYGAYDHVLLAQMWGQMINLPEGIPMVTHDILTLSLALDVDMLPKQADGVHNALADAKHVRAMYEHVMREARP